MLTVSWDCCCLAQAWNNYVSLQKQGIFDGMRNKMVKMFSNIKITTKTQQSNPREEQNWTSTNQHKAYSDNISASGNKKDFIYVFLINSKKISTVKIKHHSISHQLIISPCTIIRMCYLVFQTLKVKPKVQQQRLKCTLQGNFT